MKPEDWANLQVGAWAALPSPGVLGLSPGPPGLGAPRAHAPAHAHAQRAHGRALSRGPLPPSRSFRSLVLHAVCFHTQPREPRRHVPARTLTLAPVHTRGHVSPQMPRSHISHPSYIHTPPPTVCYTRSHARSLLTQTRSRTPIRRVRTLVLSYTYSRSYSPAQVSADAT